MSNVVIDVFQKLDVRVAKITNVARHMSWHMPESSSERASRLAVYRTADDRYSQLPERTPMPTGAVKSEPIDLTQSGEESKD